MLLLKIVVTILLFCDFAQSGFCFAIIVFILQIPETPLWLYSKQRPHDAQKSLQWLRGWVSPQEVEKEFKELQRYGKESYACFECAKQCIECSHPPPTLIDKLRDLGRKRTLKPSAMILLISVFAQFAGLTSMRSYLVLTLKAYGVPLNPNWATVN